MVIQKGFNRSFVSIIIRFNTILLLCLLTFSSCVSNRQIIYAQPEKKKGVPPTEFAAIIRDASLIKPGDELYVRVSSFDEETNFFTETRDDFIGRTDVTLVSYTVDGNGNLKLPYVGEIKVEGESLEEAGRKIEEALTGYLNGPQVLLKFVNKHVTVLGEVNRPGRYIFLDVNINVFQALGFAGDITHFGNRNKVMIIREEDEMIKRTYVDLTKESLFESDYYYLQPNDILYVAPLKRRRWGFERFPFDLVLTTLSTVVLVMNYLFITSQ